MKIEISATITIDNALSESRIVPIEQIKIGQFVRPIFRILLKNKMLLDEELKKLQDKDYCKRVFKLSSYPALLEQQERPKKHKRYYSEQIDSDFWLCSQWTKIHWIPLLTWLENLKLRDIEIEISASIQQKS